MTEIKSKRAVEVIRYSFNVNSGIGISLRHAYEAVEGAEQDARERAIKAFRHACNCGDTHSPCEIYEECSAFKIFLKYYDNENQGGKTAEV